MSLSTFVVCAMLSLRSVALPLVNSLLSLLLFVANSSSLDTFRVSFSFHLVVFVLFLCVIVTATVAALVVFITVAVVDLVFCHCYRTCYIVILLSVLFVFIFVLFFFYFSWPRVRDWFVSSLLRVLLNVCVSVRRPIVRVSQHQQQ